MPVECRADVRTREMDGADWRRNWVQFHEARGRRHGPRERGSARRAEEEAPDWCEEVGNNHRHVV